MSVEKKPNNSLGFLPQDVIFESFTYPFFDLNYSANHRLVAQAFLETPPVSSVTGRKGLYVHIPFCDTICSFCPFVKSVGNDERISAYLNALTAEASAISQTALVKSWNFNSIYFGGGTPSVLSPQQAVSLIRHLREIFSISQTPEITFEVEAKSASTELLYALSDAGVSRISFGVQTLSQKLRDQVNLTASLEQIESVIATGKKLFSEVNIDMIAGFPGQSIEDAIEDAKNACTLGVSSIAIYPFDYVVAQPKFLDRIRFGEIPPAPAGPERWELFHSAKSEIKKSYRQFSMYSFGEENTPGCEYMFQTVYGGYDDECIGLGVGAYSMIKGLAYHNIQSERDYIAAINSQRLPIERCSPGHAYEKEFVYFPKRLTAKLSEAERLGIQESILPKVEALQIEGLILVNGDQISLTPAGEMQYAQIMVGFLPDHHRRLYQRACDRLCSDLGWGFEGASNSEAAKIRGFAAKNALRRT
ncbi:coproporphyrinogen-III oxidase family protein [Methylomicrobium lacus]|uniref:coproporphyrinogen-III oxidase family protein n=1 Tax=Methylomicrobium lacus TaxID=136992 RepID=UPI0035A87EF6